ncbi:Methyltransferase domain-containing protein [Evansella caseinilytica]|uniref:Methyltransferase domain-containing protein n=1 Tax=Evansella caseinilytica TaxID=1503961 RepID=A0A1H3RZ57_9BACI|nr:class I SAM-dependent methyltransferase [Evansella caseinilytica]SDZ30867.1 Methyltransferase domain-containing protein [Evansella caseinilytica]
MNPLKMQGHLFLASLGKKMLRPGGKQATERIIEHLDLNENSTVLEVAPNMGTTAIQLVKTYGCKVYGVDIHGPSLEKATANVRAAGLEDNIVLQMGDARKLPFENETFDAVINEAMLTMLPDKDKETALQEYYRVLKPGGKLGTHDVTLKMPPPEGIMNRFWKMLNMMAKPLSVTEWQQLYATVPFEKSAVFTGNMSLLSLDGLIRDEGWKGAIAILENASRSDETSSRFLDMASFFYENTDIFGYCTVHSVK